MKYALITLGCPKNQVDSENLVRDIRACGHQPADPKDADVILLNTCSFIEEAKKESIDAILRAVSSGKRVLVTGCLAERYRAELRNEIPEVEAYFGLNETDRLLERLGREGSGTPAAGPRPLLNAPHYAYLKIAEGCDNRCTYCVIPDIRGPYRSVPAAMILEEARHLVEQGVKELIVVAQDTTAYGKDLPPPASLESLLRQLSELDVPWIRLMYTYPNALTDGMLDLIRGSGNICHYLDIPFQHSEASVLRRMGRPDQEDPRRVVERLRKRIPDLALRTSLIVGFPGETQAEYLALLRFVEETAFERLGVFEYSREEDTPAARMKRQVPRAERRRRRDELMGLQARVSHRRNLALIGSRVHVLVDETETGVSVGRTYADAPEIDGNVIIKATVRPGTFVRVRVTEAQDYDVAGVPEGEAKENPERGRNR